MEILRVNPGIMSWRVSLPAYKVLLLLPTTEESFFEYLLHFPFRFAF